MVKYGDIFISGDHKEFNSPAKEEKAFAQRYGRIWSKNLIDRDLASNYLQLIAATMKQEKYSFKYLLYPSLNMENIAYANNL